MDDGSSFDVAQVRSALAGSRFATIDWVDQIGSTNSELADRAAQGAPEGQVLGADFQSAGRGRRQRTWVARPSSAVLVSVLLRPRVDQVALVTPAVAVSAVEAIADLLAQTTTGPKTKTAKTQLKWPNDLVVERGGRWLKLAGILAEASWPPGADQSGGARSAHVRVPVVVGLGLNVTAEGRDSELDGAAISLNEMLEQEPIDSQSQGGLSRLETRQASSENNLRERFVTLWLLALERWYVALGTQSGSKELWQAWRDYSATLSQRVRVDLGASELIGEAFDIGADGELLVRDDGGVVHTVAVGDVVHLRPVRPTDEGA